VSLERERRRVTDFNREDCGQDIGGHFALSSAVTISRRLRSSAIQQYDRCQADKEMIPILRGNAKGEADGSGGAGGQLHAATKIREKSDYVSQ
jgi:hypothetical protein